MSERVFVPHTKPCVLNAKNTMPACPLGVSFTEWLHRNHGEGKIPWGAHLEMFVEARRWTPRGDPIDGYNIYWSEEG
jgi:hypothetical protein